MIKKFVSLVLVIGVLFVNLGFLMTPVSIAASSITSFSDAVTNLTASAAANHTISFRTPGGLTVGETIVLTFDSNVNTSSIVLGDIDLADDGVDVTLASLPSGAIWGVTVGSGIITFTCGTTAVTASSLMTIKIGKNATGGTNQIVNGTNPSVLRALVGGDEYGILTLPIIANSIVLVSAEVLPSLSFAVSQNTLYFGQLRSVGPCFAQVANPGNVTCPTTAEANAFTLTASTNGASGYSVSVFGPTLTSGGNTINAIGATNTASALGTEQFGMRVNIDSGTGGSVTAPYAAAGFAYNGTVIPSQVVGATAPSNPVVYGVRYLANISTLTEAGSYGTSHTYVATGNF